VFTGIVQGHVPVVSVTDENDLRRLTLDLGTLVSELQDGASVAVNGVCLTVVKSSTTAELPTGHAQFDVIQETLDRTSLGRLASGQGVNVERSYRVGDEVGGHVVSGHIAAEVPLVEMQAQGNIRNLFFQIPQEWMKYLHLKGFVALDGASLTIATADAQQGRISVSLIPETIERTSLGRLVEGGTVNLEVDAQTQAIVDTVERTLDSESFRSFLKNGV
jgi:riboflavin synthase